MKHAEYMYIWPFEREHHDKNQTLYWYLTTNAAKTNKSEISRCNSCSKNVWEINTNVPIYIIYCFLYVIYHDLDAIDKYNTTLYRSKKRFIQEIPNASWYK